MATSPNKSASVDVGIHHSGFVSATPSALNGGNWHESAGTCSRARTTARILSSAIVSHRLRPGTKLAEQAVADVLGVSRTVVRQAIILLAGEGLLSIEHNRGASVSAPTFLEALSICEALIMIEQAVAVHLVNSLQPSGWMALKRNVAQPPPADPEIDRRAAAMLDQDFHSMLVRLTRSTVACAVHAQLARRTAAFLSFDDMEIDCQDLTERRSRMVNQMERGRVLQVAVMIERHHLSLLRNCFRERQTSRKMTSTELSDCLATMADAVSFRPKSPGLVP
jgi:DNA-binding GntR family transcriptional regulator